MLRGRLRRWRGGAAPRTFGAALVLALAIAPIAASPASAGVDDYPANLRNAAQDSIVDPWLFYNRECTSFVAWRLNNRNGVGFTNYYGGPRWGNANTWDDAARAVGVPVNGTPAVGAVAQTDAGGFGHVAWVEAVNGNGTVTIEDYNHDFTGHYGERTVPTSSFVYIHVKDLPSGPPSLGNGTLISVAGSPEVYVMAGGAPVYVSSWNAIGGPKPVTVISAQQFASLRPYPADGTLVATSYSDGRVYVMAGGAPTYLSAWSQIGGPKPVVTIDQWAVDNPGNPLAHMRAYPADGTLVATSYSDGRVYVMAGGAPTYLSAWSQIGGPKPVVTIDQWAIDNPADPHAHMRAYPADGTLVATSYSDGRVYVMAGGAPTYLSTWSAIGGPRPATTIDRWAVENPTDPHAHLRLYPADGTFLRTADGSVYRVAGGTPFWVSAWSLFGGVRPVVQIDRWAVTNTADPHAHLRARPLDGTRVKGLPSGAYWSFAAGARTSTGASSTATAVDDISLAAFPLAGAPVTPPPPPVLTPPPPPPPPTVTPPPSVHLTAAQLLHRRLAHCHKLHRRHARLRCVKQARRRYRRALRHRAHGA